MYIFININSTELYYSEIEAQLYGHSLIDND